MKAINVLVFFAAGVLMLLGSFGIVGLANAAKADNTTSKPYGYYHGLVHGRAIGANAPATHEISSIDSDLFAVSPHIAIHRQWLIKHSLT